MNKDLAKELNHNTNKQFKEKHFSQFNLFKKNRQTT